MRGCVYICTEQLQRARRARTREKLTPVAQNPNEFSNVQLTNFLKTATFNQKVAEHNRKQAGKANQGSRIASEADREYLLVKDPANPFSVAFQQREEEEADKKAKKKELDDLLNASEPRRKGKVAASTRGGRKKGRRTRPLTAADVESEYLRKQQEIKAQQEKAKSNSVQTNARLYSRPISLSARLSQQQQTPSRGISSEVCKLLGTNTENFGAEDTHDKEDMEKSQNKLVKKESTGQSLPPSQFVSNSGEVQSDHIGRKEHPLSVDAQCVEDHYSIHRSTDSATKIKSNFVASSPPTSKVLGHVNDRSAAMLPAPRFTKGRTRDNDEDDSIRVAVRSSDTAQIEENKAPILPPSKFTVAKSNSNGLDVSQIKATEISIDEIETAGKIPALPPSKFTKGSTRREKENSKSIGAASEVPKTTSTKEHSSVSSTSSHASGDRKRSVLASDDIWESSKEQTEAMKPQKFETVADEDEWKSSSSDDEDESVNEWVRETLGSYKTRIPKQDQQLHSTSAASDITSQTVSLDINTSETPSYSDDGQNDVYHMSIEHRMEVTQDNEDEENANASVVSDGDSINESEQYEVPLSQQYQDSRSKVFDEVRETAASFPGWAQRVVNREIKRQKTSQSEPGSQSSDDSSLLMRGRDRQETASSTKDTHGSSNREHQISTGKNRDDSGSESTNAAATMRSSSDSVKNAFSTAYTNNDVDSHAVDHSIANNSQIDDENDTYRKEKIENALRDFEESNYDEELLSKLEEEESKIKDIARTANRDAEAVTNKMKAEVVQLLQMFGIPYIIAPMEAEAQCAELERLGLVDGVISDDADSFLFGSNVVYKNFFDDKKMVHMYKAEDIEQDLGLSRDDLVRSALLLGSDYTFGIPGIGVVNTVEILHAFPGDEGLQRFRQWLDGTYRTVEIEELARSKHSQEKINSLDAEAQFMLSHRGARKRWNVPDSFPNRMVLEAYRRPRVDSNPTEFSWFTPDLEVLRDFCMTTLEWTKEYTDRQLLPVMKELVKPTQRTLDQYIVKYEDNSRAAKVKSKRLRNALKGKHQRPDDTDIALDLSQETNDEGIDTSDTIVSEDIKAQIVKQY